MGEALEGLAQVDVLVRFLIVSQTISATKLAGGLKRLGEILCAVGASRDALQDSGEHSVDFLRSSQGGHSMQLSSEYFATGM